MSGNANWGSSMGPFGGIGPLEIIVVLIIVLVIFGPKRLPGLGRSLGSGLREFKDSIGGRGSDESRTDIAASDERRPEQPSSRGSGSAEEPEQSPSRSIAGAGEPEQSPPRGVAGEPEPVSAEPVTSAAGRRSGRDPAS